jgi:hypothetical protein
MSKLTKKDLKDIVKECLIEILAEGLATGRSAVSLNEKKDLKNQINENRVSENAANRFSYLDNIHVGKSPSKTKTTKINENVLKAAKTMTNDPIMNSIFADTAMTTLKEQGIANSAKGSISKPVDSAARIVESSDPAALFGESSQNWAHLAFADSIPKS